MNFKENLKKARVERGLTQGELAEKMNINQQQVSRWESGNKSISVEKLKELCIALNVSADKLLEINIK